MGCDTENFDCEGLFFLVVYSLDIIVLIEHIIFALIMKDFMGIWLYIIAYLELGIWICWGWLTS